MKSELTIGFGKVLRRLRADANLTQEQLGFEAGLERKFISLLELGNKQPTITTIFKLSNALNIKPGKFLTLVETETAGKLLF